MRRQCVRPTENLLRTLLASRAVDVLWSVRSQLLVTFSADPVDTAAVGVESEPGRTEQDMGRIHIDLFMTLDGVAQAPGGPEEDPTDGFAFGGWQAPLIDEVDGEQIDAGMQGMDALLLGRRTYDIFASYWPGQEDGRVGSIANLFNRIPKYVASRGALDLDWAHSTQLGEDLPAAVRELRERHEKIHVIGSLDFVQTLFAEQLFDQLNLWVYPILLGTGKQVFAGGSVPTNLRLVAPAETSPGGSVHLQYERVDGTPGTGSMDDLE